MIEDIVSFTIRQIMAEADQDHWRGWISHGPLQIYIRFTHRYVSGVEIATLDIANISIEYYYQNRGIFTGLLDQLEKFRPRNVLYIENIVASSDKNQQRLCSFLERRGFDYYNRETTPCMAKFI